MSSIKHSSAVAPGLWGDENALSTLDISPERQNALDGTTSSHKDFGELLKEGIQDVNASSKAADKAGMDLASGKNSNIHETMLALTKAEMGFQMMVQVRNKMLEAYQEVMRMQV